MDWSKIGEWLQQNAGAGAALVGSLLTGNVPGAVAAGVALVTSATGESMPDKVMAQLQTDPASMVKLRELAYQNEASIRQHIQAMTELELKDKQAEHEQTQLTIRNGDNADDPVVRRTRPYQSWVSLLAALGYALMKPAPEIEVLLILLALPWAYAGLRTMDKWGSKK